MNPYPNPCDACAVCTNTIGCEAWRIRFRYRQKQINAYARKIAPPKQENRQVFRYEHPDIIGRYLEKGPCEYCDAEKICDTPCVLYWRWWDARMEWLRRRIRE